MKLLYILSFPGSGIFISKDRLHFIQSEARLMGQIFLIIDRIGGGVEVFRHIWIARILLVG
ncbi:MAG: hypothetical protein QNJ41_03020 [Xenococcaceae cyanobacterium MO_188.B32]|nr:hypothetical protein [Xenococcaceae cyanobacterium MO_188.B32]